MSNPISANINNISQLLDTQSQNSIGSFDLSDDRFSNILDNKLGEYNQEDLEPKDITNQLGIPAGLNIEGFDYNSFVNDIDAVDTVNAINTDSNISQNNRFDLGSLIQDAGQAVSNIATNSKVTNPINSTVQEVQNFWKNQASNFYSIMNKDTVNDLSDLITKL